MNKISKSTLCLLASLLALLIILPWFINNNTQNISTGNINLRKQNYIIADYSQSHRSPDYSISPFSNNTANEQRVLSVNSPNYTKKRHFSNKHSLAINTKSTQQSQFTTMGHSNTYNMRTANANTSVGNDMLAVTQPFQNNNINIANTPLTRIAEDPLNPGNGPIGDAVLPMLVCAMLFVTFKLYNTKL